MEFPDLGKHCAKGTCRQLDFLPITCAACKQDFCKDHYSFAAHSCPFAFKKDIHVPVCPLCNSPIPVKKGELPDVVVSKHMDQNCRSIPGLGRKKIFTHRCSKEGCRQKELLSLVCDKCRGSFCIRHRHPQDHDCRGQDHMPGTARCSAPGAPDSKPSGAQHMLTARGLVQQLSERGGAGPPQPGGPPPPGTSKRLDNIRFS
ncbi:PREDICTED: AN1-type zinc finger protein 2A [Elephantulus edwardii]|uniref:AN1-type zinc finger protein 2A n=1 Tax=Elephantulus edwardii TaxID=28737 RepID=UPI0003F07FF5|nr:PREDICTED: AN1-type zinc finger protein 2A [Elephantulus edwardii]